MFQELKRELNMSTPKCILFFIVSSFFWVLLYWTYNLSLDYTSPGSGVAVYNLGLAVAYIAQILILKGLLIIYYILKKNVFNFLKYYKKKKKKKKKEKFNIFKFVLIVIIVGGAVMVGVGDSTHDNHSYPLPWLGDILAGFSSLIFSLYLVYFSYHLIYQYLI